MSQIVASKTVAATASETVAVDKYKNLRVGCAGTDYTVHVRLGGAKEYLAHTGTADAIVDVTGASHIKITGGAVVSVDYEIWEV